MNSELRNNGCEAYCILYKYTNILMYVCVYDINTQIDRIYAWDTIS